MKPLQQYAQKLFCDYAYRKTGVWLDWNYLSDARKLVWMREVKQTFIDTVVSIKEELKPSIQLVSGTTSYEKGFLAGQAFENRRIEGKLLNILEQLDLELEAFENTIKKNN